MTLQTLAQQQRRELLAREQAIANEIDAAYGGMWRSLVHRLFRLLDEMQRAEAQAQAAGVPFHATLWVRSFQRLDTMLQSVQLDMQAFAQAAQQLVLSGLPATYHAGVQDAVRLLEASLDNRIGIAFGRPSARALDLLAQRNTLFSGMSEDAIVAVRKRLLAGLALGENPRAVARSIEQGLRGVSRNRALTIARTELISSYRDANLATYRENSDVVEEWEWSTAEDERTCPLCRPLDRKRFPLSQSFNAQHFNDRCTPLPVTVSYETILARFAA